MIILSSLCFNKLKTYIHGKILSEVVLNKGNSLYELVKTTILDSNIKSDISPSTIRKIVALSDNEWKYWQHLSMKINIQWNWIIQVKEPISLTKMFGKETNITKIFNIDNGYLQFASTQDQRTSGSIEIKYITFDTSVKTITKQISQLNSLNF